MVFTNWISEVKFISIGMIKHETEQDSGYKLYGHQPNRVIFNILII